jgi:hypothetical protein
MKLRVIWLLILLGAIGAGVALRRPVWHTEAVAVQKQADAQFAARILFGLTDNESQRWDGSATVSEGRIVRLEGYHFLSEDTIDAMSWRIATRVYEPTPVQRENGVRRNVNKPGVILFLDAPARAQVGINTPQGKFNFSLADLPYGRTRKFLKDAVVIERVAVSMALTADDRWDDYPALLAQKDGALWTAWVAYKDRAEDIYASRFENGQWSEAMRVTPQSGELFRVQLAEDRRGRLCAVWAQKVKDNYDLFARFFDGKQWSAVEQLTNDPNPDILHRLISDASGTVWLAWMGFRRGQSDVLVKSFDGTRWSAEMRVSESNANDWEPALAADPSGGVWVAWDTYDKGNYDLMLRRIANNKLSETITVANSPRFEAHASIACDRQGRVWIAWDEGGANWGKDSGWFVKGKGSTLYSARIFRVACYHDGKLEEPVADINQIIAPEYRRYRELPQLAVDARDRVWVVFRHRVSRFKVQQQWNWSTWEANATCFLGDRWLPPVFLPDSNGRNDERAAIAVGKDGTVWTAWATDRRKFEELIPQKYGIYVAPLQVDLAPAAVALKPLSPSSPLASVAYEPSQGMQNWTETAPEGAPAADPNEAANVARLRTYNATLGRKTYRIVRGDLHRHTDISWDGANDGGLLDVYRYAIDAAKLDFLGVTDHSNSGASDEYAWWRNQKFVDLFYLPGTFVPMYAYERSVGYPNGHRNIIFAERGVFPLQISPDENRGQVRTGAVLYDHLRKNKGLSTPHTSASGMGNDWTDNAPDVEPVVEIYSGFWFSSEYQGAPKTRPNMNEPNYRFSPGYVWNAWAKGYKIGVQSSSDHISTHLSYACLYVENFTRAGIMQALRERHTYGASDNILIDVRMRDGRGEQFMGDTFTATKPPRLVVKTVGTGKVKQIDLIKDNAFTYVRKGAGSQEQFEYTDNAITPGTHYYYIRVWQEDDQLAWSSPLWVNYAASSK